MRNIRNTKRAKQFIEEGEKFLKENGQREEVITTKTGLQYEVLQAGTGTISPTLNNKVKVHYHGTLLNGKVFDSSVQRNKPIEFRLKQVIKGWQQGVQAMVEGEKIRLYVPNELAYGKRPIGSIPPGALLIFEIELLEIK
ncbi:FKBP-type peptidyl-prolyl cis-trans isomerase [Vibrio sp.]|nr:FKBP-type peptidyl-prolyl cis-trans isomerase [Vibrio viridaestus]MDC0609740.1 FKBP-type peptidyl-prolyl cis-trans isomerase [Vibrio sp.]